MDSATEMPSTPSHHSHPAPPGSYRRKTGRRESSSRPHRRSPRNSFLQAPAPVASHADRSRCGPDSAPVPPHTSHRRPDRSLPAYSPALTSAGSLSPAPVHAASSNSWPHAEQPEQQSASPHPARTPSKHPILDRLESKLQPSPLWSRLQSLA